MISSQLRRWIDRLKRTPLHPQWLLGRQEQLAPWLKEHCTGIILDIGSADRWIEMHFDVNTQYVALDYPETGQDLYQSRPDVFADAASLPFQDDSIDTVLLLEVLEHIAEPRKALKEIARVLKPGGRVLLTMPFIYPVHDAPFDFQRYTQFGLERELKAVGFTVDEIENSLSSSCTAGLIVCLAISGAIVQSIQERSLSIIFVPFFLLLIPILNISAWLFNIVYPNWANLSAGLQSRAHIG